MNMAWTIPVASTTLRTALTQRALNPRAPKEIVMTKTVLISITLLALSGVSAFAQSGPTPQEKMACRSDAQSFCAEHIGKPGEMNACLAANKAKLSDSCRKVVEAHGG
jgi:hypothetical protein